MLKLPDTVNGKVLFQWMKFFAPVAAIAGLISFVAVTWFGFGKDGYWAGDFAYYFAGGKCFIKGSNMYAVDCVEPILAELYGYTLLAGVSYPPHFAPFTLIFAIVPYSVASYVFYFANFIACLFMAKIISDTSIRLKLRQAISKSGSFQWALFLVLGSTGIWAAVWLGQITVFVAICLWMAFRQIEIGNDFVASILLALASVKPQMAALVFLWILLNGRYRILAFSALTAGILSIYTFAIMGVVPAIEGWTNAVAMYQNYPINQLGNNTIMGIPSFLALYDTSLPVWAGLLVGGIVVLILRWKSLIEPFSPLALATILLLQMTIFSRPYDLIFIAPAFALFWPTDRSNALRIVLFLAAAALYCFPQQLVVRVIPFPEAGHFRTLLLVVLLTGCVRQMLRGRNQFHDLALDQPSTGSQTA